MEILANQLLTCLYFAQHSVRSYTTIILLTLFPATALGAQPLAVWLRDARSTPAAGGGAEVAPAAAVDFGLPAGHHLHAILRTSLGAIDCVLATDDAPWSVKAFVDLARGVRPWIDPRTGASVSRPLYDGTLFHRVIPGFLVQGGDPTGTGAGGPGFSLADELGAASRFDKAGILGLANRGPNTGGSQFFVTAGPAHHLDGRYTRLGECGNLDVVERIAGTPRGERNRPVTPVVLRNVEIVTRGG